jgi:hypothetical protein
MTGLPEFLHCATCEPGMLVPVRRSGARELLLALVGVSIFECDSCRRRFGLAARSSAPRTEVPRDAPVPETPLSDDELAQERESLAEHLTTEASDGTGVPAADQELATTHDLVRGLARVADLPAVETALPPAAAAEASLEELRRDLEQLTAGLPRRPPPPKPPEPGPPLPLELQTQDEELRKTLSELGDRRLEAEQRRQARLQRVAIAVLVVALLFIAVIGVLRIAETRGSGVGELRRSPGVSRAPA